MERACAMSVCLLASLSVSRIMQNVFNRYSQNLGWSAQNYRLLCQYVKVALTLYWRAGMSWRFDVSRSRGMCWNSWADWAQFFYI